MEIVNISKNVDLLMEDKNLILKLTRRKNIKQKFAKALWIKNIALLEKGATIFINNNIHRFVK